MLLFASMVWKTQKSVLNIKFSSAELGKTVHLYYISYLTLDLFFRYTAIWISLFSIYTTHMGGASDNLLVGSYAF